MFPPHASSNDSVDAPISPDMERMCPDTEDHSRSDRMSESSEVWEEERISLKQAEKIKQKVKFKPVMIIKEDDHRLKRNNNSFTLIVEDPYPAFSKPRVSESGSSLMQGPRRVMRLCLFAILLPLVLILVPLYIRLIVFSPQHYSMAPSDQRVLDRSVSSIWCQGQSVHMNGSFNAYLMSNTLHTTEKRPRYTILKNLKLQDDVKEYWGFFLKAGSTVTLSTCTRYEGGQLMILRGSENLHRCAWIGEEDSIEEEERNSQFMNSEDSDLSKPRVSGTTGDSDELEDGLTNRRIGSNVIAKDEEGFINILQRNSENINVPITSEERRAHLGNLIKTALGMSKGKSEIMDLIDIHHRQSKNFMGNQKSPGKSENRLKMNRIVEEQKDEYLGGEGVKTTKSSLSNKSKRSVNDADLNDRNGAFEEVDEHEANGFSRKFTREEIGVEQIIGGVNIPEGLTYERGFLNQSNGFDMSREEHKSSYSSSEEALASCEGVILALPLQPDSYCTGFQRQGGNKISYDISLDGTYYFVFSSDNEIVVNDLFFNLTLDKVTYDVSENVANCTGSQNCSLSFNFWSEDKTVVEVPAGDKWDDFYVLDTSCEPRVWIYLSLMLLVPVFILFCAFQ